MSNVVFAAGINVYGTDECFRRAGTKGKVGGTKDLSRDEYGSYSLFAENRASAPFSWKEVYVLVDGCHRFGWQSGSLASGQSTGFHIYRDDMEKLRRGAHRASWYFDGKLVLEDRFFLYEDLDWSRLTVLPNPSAVRAYTNPKQCRSPYLAAWLDIPHGLRYTEYAVDFKTDYLPRGTYCSLGGWHMDYSALKGNYQKIGTEGCSAYAGFQNIDTGRKMSIMSFWDVYGHRFDGTVDTIRAEIDYPPHPEVGREFGGEGVGMQCIDPYEWEAGHWYRMHLRCRPSQRGTSLVEFWVCNLETGEYRLLSRYDTRIPKSAFIGPIAIFLENYLTEYAGDIRTLELCNARYLEEKTGRWCKIESGTMYPNGSAFTLQYAGSYDFGVKDGRLWIMTTGVENLVTPPKDNRFYF